MTMLTEEQTILRDSARAWAQDQAPVGAFRKMRDSGNELGFDRETFTAISNMGWTGVIIPEAYGGSEFGYRSIGLVLEELGRTLTAAPLIGSAVGAASAIMLGGTDAQKQAWLPGIAEGKVIAALAVDEGTRHHPETMATVAARTKEGYTLSGTKTFVLEGLVADLLVVAARTGSSGERHGVILFLVPADTRGIERQRRQLIDSRGYADIVFTDVKVGSDSVLGTVDNGSDLLDKVLDRARAATAAEAYGVTLQAFETTVEYMKTRVQFGQTIGSFQALQHRAAKLFTDIQMVRGVVDAALEAIDADSPNTAEMVSLAKAMVNDLINLVSREMIQLHGGIGMTDAHDAGFYLKRARTLEASFGTSAYHRERYARLKGL